MLTRKSIAIVGAGTLGRALGNGLLRAGVVARDHLRGSIRHRERLPDAQAAADFDVGVASPEIARTADVVLLCTKPKALLLATAELATAGALDHGPLLVSVAAGVRTASIEEACAACARPPRVVRAMPNTPCLIGEGMTVVSPGAHASDSDVAVAEELFRPLGRVLRLGEEHMDTVTGLSGSGPAFVYVMIEALSEGGVMMGLPRKVATELASQVARGAASMVLETGAHPAELKDDVLTPAGCTITGLLAMEDGGIRSVLARGVQQAARAAAGLGG